MGWLVGIATAVFVPACAAYKVGSKFYSDRKLDWSLLRPTEQWVAASHQGSVLDITEARL